MAQITVSPETRCSFPSPSATTSPPRSTRTPRAFRLTSMPARSTSASKMGLCRMLASMASPSRISTMCARLPSRTWLIAHSQPVSPPPRTTTSSPGCSPPRYRSSIESTRAPSSTGSGIGIGADPTATITASAAILSANAASTSVFRRTSTPRRPSRCA